MAEKDTSKVTLQSIVGYLPVYPWINCEVSKDTFSSQIFAVLSMINEKREECSSLFLS